MFCRMCDIDDAEWHGFCGECVKKIKMRCVCGRPVSVKGMPAGVFGKIHVKAYESCKDFGVPSDNVKLVFCEKHMPLFTDLLRRVSEDQEPYTF